MADATPAPAARTPVYLCCAHGCLQPATVTDIFDDVTYRWCAAHAANLALRPAETPPAAEPRMATTDNPYLHEPRAVWWKDGVATYACRKCGASYTVDDGSSCGSPALRAPAVSPTDGTPPSPNSAPASSSLGVPAPTDGTTAPRYYAEHPALDYPAAARSIALNLDEFCDPELRYPDMIADGARKASAALTAERAHRAQAEALLRRVVAWYEDTSDELWPDIIADIRATLTESTTGGTHG